MERRLRVFGNRVLRKIFGLNREEERADSRKLHNEELHKLHSSTNIIRITKLWKMDARDM
jgi:hypothetical protein